MRIVIAPDGTTWICLLLPGDGATLRLECNSGADRVEVSVPREWEELPDGELLARIEAARR